MLPPEVCVSLDEMPRQVTLVMLDSEGVPCGALPPIEIATPWWQLVDEIVDEVRAIHGVDVNVLRLLTTDRPRAQGGEISYAAELGPACASQGSSECAVRLLRCGQIGDCRLCDVPSLAAQELARTHPLRAAWAQPGGPASSIAWALEVLHAAGRGAYVARQRRTWNLSAIWRLDPVEGQDGGKPVWLKQVPPFFVQEGPLLEELRHIASRSVPSLIAKGPLGLLLLEHVPGQDRHEAPAADREAFAQLVHGIQRSASDRTSELVARGIPDRRGRRLAAYIRDSLASVTALGILGQSEASEVLETLEARLDALAQCQLPDTLVHGDFHPGNVRSELGEAVILDWGDAFIGHPGFDILRLTEDLPSDEVAPLLTAWSSRWRRECDRCDPERALRMLRPLAPLLSAAAHASFVANIEPSERIYHLGEITAGLGKARQCLSEAPSG